MRIFAARRSGYAENLSSFSLRDLVDHCQVLFQNGRAHRADFGEGKLRVDQRDAVVNEDAWFCSHVAPDKLPLNHEAAEFGVERRGERLLQPCEPRALVRDVSCGAGACTSCIRSQLRVGGKLNLASLAVLAPAPGT